MSIKPEGPAAPDDAVPPNSSTTAPDAGDATPPARRRVWIRPAVGALACVLVGSVLGFGVAKIEMPAGPAAPTASPSPSASAQPIKEALSRCGVANSSYFTVGDGGKSLTVQTVGSKKSYGASIEDTYCVLRRLNAPDSAISRMGQTRALDGRQTANWKGYSASWGYHPDDGMNLVVESTDI